MVGYGSAGPSGRVAEQDPDSSSEEPRYSIFFSHAASHAVAVTEIASKLQYPGLSTFVAGRDLDPGIEWSPILEDRLRNCDALIAYLNDDFRTSGWCDQEVGYALALGKKLVPLRANDASTAPHGFLERLQALTTPRSPAQVIADRILDMLVADPGQVRKLMPIALEVLRKERKIKPLRAWTGRLVRGASSLTQAQRSALQQIVASNSILRTDQWAHSALQNSIFKS